MNVENMIQLILDITVLIYQSLGFLMLLCSLPFSSLKDEQRLKSANIGLKLEVIVISCNILSAVLKFTIN